MLAKLTNMYYILDAHYSSIINIRYIHVCISDYAVNFHNFSIAIEAHVHIEV